MDLLSLGALGVNAAKKQLNTTGHNIANANTPGYSKQRVEQKATDSYRLGADRWGTGVEADQVYRIYDKFAVNELNLVTSMHSHASTRDASISVLDDMMSFSAQKIPENMNAFFGALNALEDTPNDLGARKVVLENAKSIAASFNDINYLLQNRENDVADEIKGTVKRINDIGEELADIHKALTKADGEDNDLLDQHQNLINELAKYTRVTVNQRGGFGAYNVLIGSGHTLVSGVTSTKLTTIPDKLDPAELGLALVTGDTIKAIENKDIQGKLGALFEFRNLSLKQARDELGLVAMGVAFQLNHLQEQGYDLNGAIGKNMFTDFNNTNIATSRVVQSPSSSAKISVFIDDLAKLKPQDYELTFDGSQYTLIDPNRGQQQAVPTGSPPTIKIDGLSIQINAGLAAGERVLIRPMKHAAGQIDMLLNEASQIAAQSYITSNSKLFGNANLSIIDKGSPKAFQVVISDDGKSFSVLSMDNKVLLAANPYPPRGIVKVNDTSFALSAGAMKNDKFVVSTIPADGDNSNLIKMQELQTKKVMYSQTASIIDVFEKLNSDIGAEKASFSHLAAVSKEELNAATARVEEISGVNLDEEAANMIKFQQAYIASSRVMSAANEAFDTLLNATR